MDDDKQSQTSAGNKPTDRHDGSRDAARTEQQRQSATNFREMSQRERLNDRATNPAAKSVAAMDAVINAKYGLSTPEAARMRFAAREAAAQTLERGNQVRTPQMRSIERTADRGEQQRREDLRQVNSREADRNARDLER